MFTYVGKEPSTPLATYTMIHMESTSDIQDSIFQSLIVRLPQWSSP